MVSYLKPLSFCRDAERQDGGNQHYKRKCSSHPSAETNPSEYELMYKYCMSFIGGRITVQNRTALGGSWSCLYKLRTQSTLAKGISVLFSRYAGLYTNENKHLGRSK